MKYKLPEDIKEESKELDYFSNLFSLKDKSFTGSKTIDNEKYNLKGIFINGLPHGLIIINFKLNKNKLECKFDHGKPIGQWVLYDKNKNIIKSKLY